MEVDPEPADVLTACAALRTATEDYHTRLTRDTHRVILPEDLLGHLKGLMWLLDRVRTATWPNEMTSFLRQGLEGYHAAEHLLMTQMVQALVRAPERPLHLVLGVLQDVDASNVEWTSPLVLQCVVDRNVACLRALLQAGADVRPGAEPLLRSVMLVLGQRSPHATSIAEDQEMFRLLSIHGALYPEVVMDAERIPSLTWVSAEVTALLAP